MEITKQTRIGELVAHDIQHAKTLQTHHIDFCCGGERLLSEVCQEKGLDFEEIKQQLKSDYTTVAAPTFQFANWSLDLMIDYLVKYHHHYIRSQGPVSYQLLEKVHQVHGPNHPELKLVKELFYNSLVDLHQHLDKEEQILFVFIRKLIAAEAQQQPLPEFHCGSIENPIGVMMSEHQNEGILHEKIAQLTHNYTPPADACTSYKLALQLLKEFEQNLHIHIHVENNLLFPRAIALQEKLGV